MLFLFIANDSRRKWTIPSNDLSILRQIIGLSKSIKPLNGLLDNLQNLKMQTLLHDGTYPQNVVDDG